MTAGSDGTSATEDATDLARVLAELLDDPGARAELAARAAEDVDRYDWSTVATAIERVYETVVG